MKDTYGNGVRPRGAGRGFRGGAGRVGRMGRGGSPRHGGTRRVRRRAPDEGGAPAVRVRLRGQAVRPLPSASGRVTSEERTEGRKLVRTVVWTDPSTGLRVTAVYTVFLDFPAAEWVVRFKNTGRAATPILEKVRACAVSLPDFAGSADSEVMLYRARGSSAQRSDFGPIDETLAPKGEFRFGPTAGRSSDTNALPFFNVAAAGHGVVAAIGWSGRWEAAVGRKATTPRAIDLAAGLAETHFKLLPGEEVRTPSVALLFWKGEDRMAGHNLFRRFVLAHHMPQSGGQPVPLPINHGVGFGGPFPCNEYVCATESYAIGMIERLHQFGIGVDACWIDAGWYENATVNWWSGVGTWTVNRKNFPRGLKPVTEAAGKHGQGFVVWFEPERVYEGTWLDREHQDWLTLHARQPEPPARPGRSRGAGVAYRSCRGLHPGRGRDRLSAGLQLRSGAVLEGHGRAGPDRRLRNEAHRRPVQVLGRLARAEPGAPHRQLRVGRAAHRPGNDESQHPAAGGPITSTTSRTATSATPTACTSSCRRAARATAIPGNTGSGAPPWAGPWSWAGSSRRDSICRGRSRTWPSSGPCAITATGTTTR
ncbi:MAG: alpha-galactosidase [Desulfosudis oleivorans]|nr:alpha-galactosidase [Desulfosudis oleivorans]